MKSVNIAVDGKYAEESAQEMIEDLREVLEKLGITVEITEGFHDTKYLSFRYDVDEIRKKAGRNAGGISSILQSISEICLCKDFI